MKCPCCRQEVHARRDVMVSLETNSLSYGDHVVKLSAREAEIAQVLADRMAMVLREVIIQRVWGLEETPSSAKSIDVHIVKLRRKLAPIGLVILTHWGRGFELAPEELSIRTSSSGNLSLTNGAMGAR